MVFGLSRASMSFTSASMPAGLRPFSADVFSSVRVIAMNSAAGTPLPETSPTTK